MALHFLEQDPAALQNQLAQPEAWLVACLCAEWCGSCRDYRKTFAAAAARYPDRVFVWIDIEEHADAIGDADIDNFPTLLIQRGLPGGGTSTAFFGTILPHADTLERLLSRVSEAMPEQADAPDVRRWLLAQ